MLIYANLCKFMQMNCDVIGHVTALDQSEQSKLGHKPATQLTRSAPWWQFHHKRVQYMLIYANIGVIGHVTALDQ